MLQNKKSELPLKHQKFIGDLYSEYKSLMLCVATKIVKNKDHATDIVHSSFESLMKHAGKLAEMSKKEVKGFIILTVKNKALDFIDLHENKRTLPLDTFTEFIPSESLSTEQEAIINIEIDSIMNQLESLDRKYSVPVFHKYVLGYSIEEVAESLGISVPNAKVRCSRGRSMLLGLLEAEETDE